MVKCIAIAPVLLILGAAVFGRQEAAAPADFKVPPELVGKTNPVHPTAAGLALARRMYGYDCAMCHGKDGDGKGDMAADMKPPLKDYRDPASLKDMSDGEMFYIIQKGKGQMPPEEGRGKPDQLWTMVALVRSFAKK
jgi:mono/diheme cytochrome c family protein